MTSTTALRASVTLPARAHQVALIVVAILAVTITLVASIAHPTEASAASPEGCPPVQIVMIPGTTETNPSADEHQPVGLLAGVTGPLLPKFGQTVDAVFIPYEASAFDKGKTYPQSKATGVTNGARFLQTRAAQCPTTKFALGGYSQGADAMGDINWLIGHDKLSGVDANRIIAVGLVADPRRAAADGSTSVGPPLDGVGIAGPRPGGFGRTASVTRSYCATGDLYCNTNSDKDGFLAGLGRVLGQPASASPSPQGTNQPSVGDLQQAMVSDYSKVDLPGLNDNIGTLQSQLRSANPDLNAVGTATANITNTLVPVADSAKWVASTPAVAKSLQTADPNSPEFATGQVIDKVNGIDIPGALRTLGQITQTVQAATTGGTTVSPQAMQSSADNLSTQIAPLTMTPTDQLNLAANALSVIKPSVLIDQVKIITTNAFAFAQNIPAIIDLLLHRIPQTIIDGGLDIAAKIKAVHAAFDELNKRFEPVVKLAASLDYGTAASLIALIPDPYGAAPIIAMIVRLLGSLDIIGLANNVGALQQQLWHALETGDIISAGLGALPHLLDFARIAFATLTGGTKTDPAKLGQPTESSQSGQAITAQTQAGDLGGLASSLTSLAGSQGADALAGLASEGMKAAAFFGSNVHTVAYTNDPVDSQGNNTLQDMSNYFSQQISKVTG